MNSYCFVKLSLSNATFTGFETSFRLDLDIKGRNGISLNDHHTPHPRTYLSVAVDGFPNMFQALGPNASVGAGNLLLIMERQVDYAVAATLKIQRERIKSIEAKSEAVDDFEKYIDVSIRIDYLIKALLITTYVL